jgi:hypothetical protein
MKVIFIFTTVIITVLKMDEAEEIPSNDGIIAQGNIERHDSTADVNTAEVQ